MVNVLAALLVALGPPLAAPYPEASTPPPVEQAERLIIDKSDRTLVVLFANGSEVTLSDLRFGSAWNQGPKRQRGDRKTPEGEYRVIEHRASRIDYPDVIFFPALYLDYPNAADQAASEALGADPGDAIMIHGPDPSLPAGALLRDWTDGCAALSQEQIAYLMTVTHEGTPVTIQP